MGNNKKKKKIPFPFVSICTPTFNRRPFIPFMIKCFEHQTYPKDKIEWIIIDDGTDPIGDLVKDIPQVKYYYFEKKMELGKKRNLMHTKCSGDILIYMDDDDYYPPERVSHAVKMLQDNPKILFAGSSEMHIYFESRNMLYQCGPYGPYHATAATFAFKKELLKQTSYGDEFALAEESKFTKKYTIPMVQLDTLKTILVCSHKHNSLSKEKLLQNPEQYKLSPSKYTIDDFVKDPILKQFYCHDMNKALIDYEPGKPENKPIVMKQIQQLEEENEKRILQQKNMFETQQQILYHQNEYEQQIANKNILIEKLFQRIKELTHEISVLKNTNTNANNGIIINI